MAINNSNRWSNFKLQSPTLMDRYNRGQVYGQRLNNDQAGQAMWAKDPWFMIGSSLGQTWGDRFNERGVAKGNTEMNQALNGYLGQFANQQQQQPSQEQQAQGQSPLLDMMSKNNGNMTLEANMPKGEDAGMGSPYITTAPVDPSQPQNYAEFRKAYKDEQWHLP